MYSLSMRTTIEIPDEQRARLLEIAARRGEKGFSRLVQEALTSYLDEAAAREQKTAGAIAVLGSLSSSTAEDLRESVRAARAKWR